MARTRIGTIYKVTNIKTSKVYIGFTINDVRQRWRGHVHSALKQRRGHGINIFHESIRKHGREQFLIEEIYCSKDLDHCYKVMEQYFICDFDTMHPNGYNSIPGGDRSGIIHSDGTLKRISASTKSGMANMSQEKRDTMKSNMSIGRKTLGNNRKVLRIFIKPDGTVFMSDRIDLICYEFDLNMKTLQNKSQNNSRTAIESGPCKGWTCFKPLIDEVKEWTNNNIGELNDRRD